MFVHENICLKNFNKFKIIRKVNNLFVDILRLSFNTVLSIHFDL